MVTLVLILLILGVTLLCIELFAPGFGLLGISGIILFIVSSVLTVLYIPMGLMIVLAELIVLAIAMYAIVSYVRKKQLYGKLILNETLNTDQTDIGDLSFFMGKEGVTKTTLRPFGIADFNGIHLEVCSDGPYVPQKRKVKVCEIVKNKVVVRMIDEQNA